MENNLPGSADAHGRPTADEARAALQELSDDRASLADRVVTPAWYHPVLGAMMALLIAAQVAPAWLMLPAQALAIAGPIVLATVYARRYGVWISRPAGKSSSALLVAFAAVVVACLGAAVVIRFAHLPWWWVLVPALVAFVAVVVLGRRYDAALRSDIAGGGR